MVNRTFFGLFLRDKGSILCPFFYFWIYFQKFDFSTVGFFQVRFFPKVGFYLKVGFCNVRNKRSAPADIIIGHNGISIPLKLVLWLWVHLFLGISLGFRPWEILGAALGNWVDLYHRNWPQENLLFRYLLICYLDDAVIYIVQVWTLGAIYTSNRWFNR